MKILMLADGRSVHTVRYQRAMKARGVDLTLASLERGDTVDVLLKKKSVSNSLNYFFVNRQIKDLVRKLEPDLVNPHFASGYGFSVAVSKVWRRYPVLLHCLGSDILLSPKKSIAHKRRVIYALQKAGKILVDSDYLANETKTLFDHPDISVIPWGVEAEMLDIFSARKIPTNYSRPLKILTPRPHQDVYNNSFIISALQNQLRNGDLKITFPAWGDMFDDFKRQVANLGLENSVDYYPFLKRDEYIKIILKYGVYLSAAKSDSSPASLIEAMGSGLLPVVADIPGVREWANDNSCLMYDNDDEPSIRRAFETILNKEKSFESLLKGNHAQVRERAQFENNIDQTVEMIKKQIENYGQ